MTTCIIGMTNVQSGVDPGQRVVWRISSCVWRCVSVHQRCVNCQSVSRVCVCEH